MIVWVLLPRCRTRRKSGWVELPQHLNPGVWGEGWCTGLITGTYRGTDPEIWEWVQQQSGSQKDRFIREKLDADFDDQSNPGSEANWLLRANRKFAHSEGYWKARSPSRRKGNHPRRKAQRRHAA